MKHLLSYFTLLLFSCFSLHAQTENKPAEFELIAATIQEYIDGTANGKPEKLRKAFHPDFNLYMVSEDSLRIRSGEQYIAKIKPGEKANRIGRIISIDFEKDAAIAKAEISVPGWRIFTDYFLLLKYEGSSAIDRSYLLSTTIRIEAC